VAPAAPAAVDAAALTAALERAAAFVARAGSEAERRLADRLLGKSDAAPLAELCAADLTTSAEIDCDRARAWLARLADARALHLPEVERLCRRLEAAQRPDGSWPGADGSLEARLVRTGCLAGALARTPFARPECLERAADFLAEHFEPDRVKEGAWETLFAYAQTFALVPHDAADGILQWCGRELERDYRDGVTSAVRAARTFRACDTLSLPGGSLALAELLAPILAAQEPDGGWLDAADPSPATRVQLTLDAFAALAAIGSRSPRARS
jgi:hypothetical protein